MNTKQIKADIAKRQVYELIDSILFACVIASPFVVYFWNMKP